MSQDEIFEFLKQHEGQKYSATQLSDELGVGEQSIYRNLKQLSKSNHLNIGISLIESTVSQIDSKFKKYRYSEHITKRRIKVYWYGN